MKSKSGTLCRTAMLSAGTWTTASDVRAEQGWLDSHVKPGSRTTSALTPAIKAAEMLNESESQAWQDMAKP